MSIGGRGHFSSSPPRYFAAAIFGITLVPAADAGGGSLTVYLRLGLVAGLGCRPVQPAVRTIAVDDPHVIAIRAPQL